MFIHARTVSLQLVLNIFMSVANCTDSVCDFYSHVDVVITKCLPVIVQVNSKAKFSQSSIGWLKCIYDIKILSSPTDFT